MVDNNDGYRIQYMNMKSKSSTCFCSKTEPMHIAAGLQKHLTILTQLLKNNSHNESNRPVKLLPQQIHADIHIEQLVD